MRTHAMTSLRMLLTMSVLTGGFYPLFITAVSQLGFHHSANGRLIHRSGTALGSELIAQPFQAPEYFWPRPSATGYSPLPSGGTNLAPTSAVLASQVAVRRAELDSAHGEQPIPIDLLYASGSGLDPHISPEAAVYQAKRVSAARGLQGEVVLALIQRQTEPRTLGFLGEPRVNVLLLNLALDSLGR